MVRKFLVFLAASSFGLLLLLTATLTGIVLTFTSGHAKVWLKSGNAYNTIVGDVLQQQQSQVSNSNGDSSISLSDPGVQTAIKKTLTPEFLQSSAEQLVDGTAEWLNGKAGKPTFRLDLTSTKANLAQNVGDYELSRYDSLPACKPGEVPDTSDLSKISCQVPGFNAQAEIQKSVNDLKTSKDFLPNPVITADTLTSGNDKQPVFEKLHNIPKFYRLVHITPVVLGVLSLLSGATVIFLSAERRRGVKRVTASLVYSGILLVVGVWLITFGFTKADNALLTKSTTQNNAFMHTGLTILNEIEHSLNHIILIFGVGFLAAAIVLVLYLILTRPKTHDSEIRESTQATGEVNPPVAGNPTQTEITDTKVEN